MTEALHPQPYQTINLSDRQPTAFMCLTLGPGNTTRVGILPRLMRYMDMPGELASGFHDQALGLLGDIMPHKYPAVEVSGALGAK